MHTMKRIEGLHHHPRSNSIPPGGISKEGAHKAIRTGLKDYRTSPKPLSQDEILMKWADEALAVHQALLSSKPPAETRINALKNWFLRMNPNNDNKDSRKQMSSSRLFGGIATLFSNPSDLIALRVPADQDRLSVFILTYFGSFFHRQKQYGTSDSDPDSSSAYIYESSLQRAIAIISSILSAIILFGSIVSLYFVHNSYYYWGCWVRENVFAATAAYCAVLVVFISGSLGGDPANGVGADGSWNCTRITSGSGSGGIIAEVFMFCCSCFMFDDENTNIEANFVSIVVTSEILISIDQWSFENTGLDGV
ncbi:uncharacterized protein RAG0_16171 [Rhynchosporium agropyri]|uniref:DUF6594 domain-containing protein n=1 Tax=Rhynchosporium agropyri TaxID=914238 RepID=A0A1E1LR23_9HELO|nr:uncharacterized protein RAG0_16171 [Rhynchosporium agropyri]